MRENTDQICFRDGGLNVAQWVYYLPFHYMLNLLTYVSLWLSTQISFQQDMPKNQVHMS